MKEIRQKENDMQTKQKEEDDGIGEKEERWMRGEGIWNKSEKNEEECDVKKECMGK
jgi:hypothetical protein